MTARKRRNGKPGAASHLHVWIGRLTIITGIINGGLGMYVAGNAGGMEIMAYSIFAALVMLAWLGAMGAGAFKRHRRDVPRRRRKAGGGYPSEEEVVDEDLGRMGPMGPPPPPAVMAGGRKARY
jgi:hypothetical protein